jgi:hypothetical protein
MVNSSYGPKDDGNAEELVPEPNTDSEAEFHENGRGDFWMNDLSLD